MNISSLQNNELCPNRSFLVKVVGIIFKHLLNQGFSYDLCNRGTILNTLLDVYKDIKNRRNNPDIIPKIPNLYFVNGNSLKTTINPSLLTDKLYGIYAGLDLPVWLNNPSSCTKKVMVIGQDPRRNSQEMQNMPDRITLSTPFGLHSLSWRTSRKGLIHQVFIDLINDYYQNHGSDLCVYYTDFYKFRRADISDDKSVIDSVNKGLYMDVLQQEIFLFDPDIIIPVGCKTASDVMNQPIKTADCFKLCRNKYVPILHPSGSNNGNIERIKAKFNYSGSTFDFYKDMIRPLI